MIILLTIYIQVLSVADTRYGYNAAKDQYEDLMAAGILDPSKVFLKPYFSFCAAIALSDIIPVLEVKSDDNS